MIIDKPMVSIMQDSTWADGLRGLAALYVASSHLVLCFGRQFVTPCCADDSTRTPWLFQRPVLRLIACGHSWVAIFFVLLGFVNALKPIKQARSGNAESALVGLSTASFRRSFRLVLPATVATIISWFLCQLGLYEVSLNSDAFWLYLNTPSPSASWGQALEDLVHALGATWRPAEENPYDQPQWALIYLLEGSIMTFFVLVATVQLRPLWRAVTVGMCLIWSWTWSYAIVDPLVGYAVLGGVLLAEFSVTTLPATLSAMPIVSGVLAPLLALVSLVLMSFPSSNIEDMPWSVNLNALFAAVFPRYAQVEMPRLVGSTGALLLCLAILVSPHMRRALSIAPLRWLGKLSFPIYLLHATFMRTLLAWLVFAGQPMHEFPAEQQPPDATETVMVLRRIQPGTARIAFSIVVSGAVMLYASHLWTNNLEPIFGRITAWAEAKMKRPDDGPILTTTRREERQDKQG